MMRIYLANKQRRYSGKNVEFVATGAIPENASVDIPKEEDGGIAPGYASFLVDKKWVVKPGDYSVRSSTSSLIHISEIVVSGEDKHGAPTCRKAGNIWWIKKNTRLHISAVPNIPELLRAEFAEPKAFVVMAEMVLGGSKVQGDVRFEAWLKQGEFKLQSTSGFTESGNYVIRSERLNQGLERIHANFRVEFNTLEFNVIQP